MVTDYFRRLTDLLGIKFLIAVAAVYGANQGLSESLSSFAGKFLLLDPPPEGLGLTAAEMTAFTGIAMTPWIFKALYGLLSDRVPICGYKRAPYIVIAGICGCIANAGLAGVHSPWAYSAFAFLSALGTALPDVMVDAVVAERSRANPALAADLQVLRSSLTINR